jgi:hypothetical protein
MFDPEPDLCEPQPLPKSVPEGWQEYFDYSCTCRFYLPGSKELMPEPIQWKQCPPLPDGIECMAMVINWRSLQDNMPIYIGAAVQFDRNLDGSAVLGIGRVSKTNALTIIADADGPVRSAVLRVHPEHQSASNPGCYLWTQSAHEGRYLHNVRGDDPNASSTKDHEGALGGSLDAPKPTLLAHFINTDTLSNTWMVGAKWIDPERLEPRRVRWQWFGLKDGGYAFKVGCGYAAQTFLLDGVGWTSQIVRLSDGMLWVLPRTPEFIAHRPLGLTCDEVFILGEIRRPVEYRAHPARLARPRHPTRLIKNAATRPCSPIAWRRSAQAPQGGGAPAYQSSEKRQS